jgi:multiple antibiotic resistance protein
VLACAISLVILQGTEAVGAAGVAILAVAIVAAMLGSLAVLLVASRASHVVGENSRRVVTRIMGLLTVAFAVQYVLDGVDGWLMSG